MVKNMFLRKGLLLAGATFLTLISYAQTDPNSEKEAETELPVKVHHIEPLYIDLVRDLGARKGEKELNIGAEFVNTPSYSIYKGLVEYEFAPIDRLGLEVEADFSFYDGYANGETTPGNRMDGLKLSAQYSFYVSPKYKTTLAVGYAHTFELTDFDNYGNGKFVQELVYSPFFVAAKRWGNSFHTLILLGPDIKQNLNTDYTDVDWQFNTSFHYEIPNTSNFLGVEFNKAVVNDKFEMTMRPQAKLQLNEALALGIVTGFPLTKSEEKFSTFFRVIYEL